MTKWWKHVKETLAQAGETKKDSAQRAGITAPNYSKWESGTIPSPEIAVRFARAYGQNVLEALVRIDLITQEEAGKVPVGTIDQEVIRANLSDLDLLQEIVQRVQENERSLLNEPLSQGE